VRVYEASLCFGSWSVAELDNDTPITWYPDMFPTLKTLLWGNDAVETRTPTFDFDEYHWVRAAQ
jgi:hypothetical protein